MNNTQELITMLVDDAYNNLIKPDVQKLKRSIGWGAFREEVGTIRIKSYRQSGHTLAANMLLEKYPGSCVMLHHHRQVESFNSQLSWLQTFSPLTHNSYNFFLFQRGEDINKIYAKYFTANTLPLLIVDNYSYISNPAQVEMFLQSVDDKYQLLVLLG